MKSRLAFLPFVLLLAVAGCGGGGAAVDVGALAGTFDGTYTDTLGTTLGTSHVTISQTGAVNGSITASSNNAVGVLQGSSDAQGNFHGHFTAVGTTDPATGTIVLTQTGINFGVTVTESGGTGTFIILADRQ